MRCVKYLSIACLALLCSPKTLAPTPRSWEQTATSSVRTDVDSAGNAVITTVNRRFTLTEPLFIEETPTDEEYQVLLLLEDISVRQRSGSESKEGTIRVEARSWKGLRADPARAIWTIEHEGDSGGPFDGFYKITKYPCCFSCSTEFYFNLLTGRELFAATSPLLAIVVPNTSLKLTRYAAYHSSFGIIPPAEFKGDETIAGILQYGSEDSILYRVAIRSKNRNDVETNARLKSAYKGSVNDPDTLMLWDSDGKKNISSLSDFSVVLDFGEIGSISIPVVNDALDLTRATVPARFTLELVK